MEAFVLTLALTAVRVLHCKYALCIGRFIHDSLSTILWSTIRNSHFYDEGNLYGTRRIIVDEVLNIVQQQLLITWKQDKLWVSGSEIIGSIHR